MESLAALYAILVAVIFVSSNRISRRMHNAQSLCVKCAKQANTLFNFQILKAAYVFDTAEPNLCY